MKRLFGKKRLFIEFVLILRYDEAEVFL